MADDEKQPKVVIIPAPIWLLSFGDTIALMLAFFVMLFAMSSVDEVQISRLVSAISTSEISEIQSRPAPNSNKAIQHNRVYNGLSVQYIDRLISSKISVLPILQDITTKLEDDSIIVTIPNSIFIPPDNVELNVKGSEILFELALILASIGNLIYVEGHSPPQNIEPDQPFSNRWALRLIRSTLVAQELRSFGLLSSLKVYGWPTDNIGHTTIPNIPLEKQTENQVNLRITGFAGGQ